MEGGARRQSIRVEAESRTAAYTDIDADVGYGPNTALGTNGYTGGLAVPSGNKNLPYWTRRRPERSRHGSGNVTAANYLGLNPYIIGSHVLPIQTQVNTDKVNQVKLDGTWHNGCHDRALRCAIRGRFLRLEGVRHLHQQRVAALVGVWPGLEQLRVLLRGQGMHQPDQPAGGRDQGGARRCAAAGLFTPASVSNFIHGYNGSNLPQSLLLYNPYSVLNYLITQPINADYMPSAGYGPYTGGYPDAGAEHRHRAGSGAEELFAVRHRPAKRPARRHDPQGQRGTALAEDPGDRSPASAQPLQSLGLEPGDVTAYQLQPRTGVGTTAHQSYSYVLPSLDLNLLVQPNLKVRADFSRTETRAEQ